MKIFYIIITAIFLISCNSTQQVRNGKFTETVKLIKPKMTKNEVDKLFSTRHENINIDKSLGITQEILNSVTGSITQ